MQEPPVQRSALLTSQALHVPDDGEPQCWKLPCDISQVEPEVQQPVQPLVALHTQVALAPLPLQTVPAGQAAPVEPHAQAPLAQRFALVGLQVAQLPPPVVPQLLVSIVLWQAPEASQQPLGHDVASQTQPPETQRWPAAQTLPPGPHEQPLPTQRSASVPQATQAAPPVAQPTPGPGVLQLEPAQQPPVQVTAQPAQAPLTQLSPEVHGVQLLPPLPHCVSDGVTQLPVPSQQPLGHEVASQTQLPPEQR
jgi:hypothetical protein